MKILQPYSLFLSAFLFCLGCMVGCSEQKPGDEDASKDSTAEMGKGGDSASTRTPSGRTQLPTPQTAAPDLWISLPAGFSIHAPTTSGYDMLVVSRTDDPLLKDSTQTPLGMLRVVVSDSVFLLTPPDMKVAEKNAMVGTYPGKWRYYTGRVPGGLTYYSYELVASHYFAGISPEKAMRDLHLHLFIAGKDTVVISQLVRAAESISVNP